MQETSLLDLLHQPLFHPVAEHNLKVQGSPGHAHKQHAVVQVGPGLVIDFGQYDGR